MLSGAGCNGKPNLETCVARLGADLDSSPVLLHDALNRIEPQSGPLADCLRRKERFKNVWLNFSRNSRSIVANFNHNRIIGAIGAHTQFPLTAHGVDCVIDEIRPNLVEFTAKRIHKQRHASIIAFQLDSLFQLVIQDR